MYRKFIARVHNSSHNNQGFTLIEVVIGIAIFTILTLGMIGSYGALANSVRSAREKVVLSTLAANYLEIVKNMPYSDIGTINGNPNGPLADENNPIQTTIEGKTYQIYYEVFNIHDPSDPVPSSVSYKQVKISIRNMVTGIVTTFLTSISNQGLGGDPNTGAIQISVINASGQPVSDASIAINSVGLTPSVNVNRTSDSVGSWLEAGLATGVNAYHIVVTKNGYSTDQTYPITIANPNPIKPDATVSAGQVTQITFVIDLLSNLTIRTLDEFCQPLSGINVNVKGAKLIGTNPNVLKFDQSYSSVAGQIALTNIEWDTYTPTLLANQAYMLYGSSPVQQISVLPGASQVFTLILGTATTNSLLVIVKDSATGSVLEGANVHLQKGGSEPQDYYAITGGSVWVQSDWSGGTGQANWDFNNPDRYNIDDGNIDSNSAPTGMRLKKTSGRYALSGWAESSTFDTGAGSNFTTLVWEPTSQDAAATLKFQIASNNDNATWSYKGPDGTANTYYTVSGSSINSVHSGDRYIRYKAYLSTTNNKKTPVLTSLNLNYVSGCYTPGQSIFPGLTAGNNYTLEVSLTGYQTQTLNSLDITGNQIIEVLLSP